MPIVSISYLAAAVAFLVLGGLVLVSWRNRPGAIWVLAASFLSFVWALSLALLTWQFPERIAVSLGVLEVARNAGWFAVLLSILALGSGGAYLHSRSLRIWIALTARSWSQSLSRSSYPAGRLRAAGWPRPAC